MIKKVIHKFSLTKNKDASLGEPIVVDMPSDAYITHVGVQDDELFIWAIVKKDAKTKPCSFAIFATGQEIPFPRDAEFVGTVLTDGGIFVWHVFKIWEEWDKEE